MGCITTLTRPVPCQGSEDFGVFGAPAGLQWMQTLARELSGHWEKFVTRRLQDDVPFPDWRGPWQPLSKHILHNQITLGYCVQANCRVAQIHPPLLYHPFPWYLESWGQLGTTVRQYAFPSESDLLRSSVLVNLWGSQWSPPTQQAALRWALAAQTARLSPRVPDLSASGSGEELRVWILAHGSLADGQRLLRRFQAQARAARRGPYSR